MKRGNLKSFICGMLVTVLLLGLAIPAFAANLVTKELYYNNIKVRLNGETLTLKDANGKIVDPFIIDGTTYLPVRAISEALGLNVSWDGATQTVILGNDPVSNQPTAWLGDLTTFSGEVRERITTNEQYNDNSTANDGSTYTRYYDISSDEGVTYLLQGKYTQLTGTLYLSSHGKNTNSVQRYLVYLDDQLVYTSSALTSGVEPIPININVSGAYKVTIIRQRQENNNSNSWGNHGTQGGYSDTHIGNAALWTN